MFKTSYNSNFWPCMHACSRRIPKL